MSKGHYSKGLATDVRVGESLRVEVPGTEGLTITLEAKSGQVARLRIQGDKEVTITRPRREALQPG